MDRLAVTVFDQVRRVGRFSSRASDCVDERRLRGTAIAPPYFLVVLALLGSAGCTSAPYSAAPYGLAPAGPVAVCYDNPILLVAAGPEQIWEHVVGVVDDYFEIARETPVSQSDDVGRLDTVPLVGATLLEPWRHDTANMGERIESTLQTIRRQAVVHVSRAGQGWMVEVIVYKQLEAVAQPDYSTAGSAMLRYDDSLTRVVNPVTEVPIDEGWIGMGRDTALEQRILGQLVALMPAGGAVIGRSAPACQAQPPAQCDSGWVPKGTAGGASLDQGAPNR
jgi:hypothetical protein